MSQYWYYREPQLDPVVATKVQTRLKHYYTTELKKVPFVGWDPKYKDIGLMTDYFVPPTMIQNQPSGGLIRYIEEDDYMLMFEPWPADRTADRILALGPSGCGKTFLANRLALQWAEQDDEKKELPFNALFLIRMGAIVEGITFQKIVLDQLLPDLDLTEEDMVNFIQSQQEQICIVFDSYDQYSMGTNEEVDQILKRKRLRSCTVLTLSRKQGMPIVRGYFDKYYEFASFNGRRQQEFLKKFFRSSPEKAEGLWKEIEARNLVKIGSYPVLLLGMCLMFEQTGNLLETRHELYKEVFHFMYMRENTLTSLVPFNDIYTTVGKDAFTNLCLGNNYFEIPPESDLYSNAIAITILKVYHYVLARRGAKHAEFLDESVFGHLAAWHMINNEEAKFGNYIKTLEKNLFPVKQLIQSIPGLVPEGKALGPTNIANVSRPVQDRIEKELRCISEIIIQKKCYDRYEVKTDHILWTTWGSGNMSVGRTELSKLWEMMVECHHTIGLSAFNRCDLWCGQLFFYVVGDDASTKLVADEFKYMGLQTDPLQLKEGYKTPTPVLIDIRGDTKTEITYSFQKDILELKLPELTTRMPLGVANLTVLFLADVQIEGDGLLCLMKAMVKVLFLLRVDVSEPTSIVPTDWVPFWQYVVIENGTYPESVARALASCFTLAGNNQLENLDVWGSSLLGTEDIWSSAEPPKSIRSVTFGGDADPVMAKWAWRSPSLQYCTIELLQGIDLANWQWPRLIRLLDIGGICSIDQLGKMMPCLSQASSLTTLILGELSGSKDPGWTVEKLTQTFEENPFERHMRCLRLSLGFTISSHECLAILKSFSKHNFDHHRMHPHLEMDLMYRMYMSEHREMDRMFHRRERERMYRHLERESENPLFRIEMVNVHPHFMELNESYHQAVVDMAKACHEDKRIALIIVPWLEDKEALIKQLPEGIHDTENVKVKKRIDTRVDPLPLADNIWPAVFEVQRPPPVPGQM